MQILNKISTYINNKTIKSNSKTFDETKRLTIELLKQIDYHIEHIEKDDNPDNFSFDVLKRLNKDLSKVLKYI